MWYLSINVVYIFCLNSETYQCTPRYFVPHFSLVSHHCLVPHAWLCSYPQSLLWNKWISVIITIFSLDFRASLKINSCVQQLRFFLNQLSYKARPKNELKMCVVDFFFTVCHFRMCVWEWGVSAPKRSTALWSQLCGLQNCLFILTENKFCWSAKLVVLNVPYPSHFLGIP